MTIIGKNKTVRKLLEEATRLYGHLPAVKALELYLGRIR